VVVPDVSSFPRTRESTFSGLKRFRDRFYIRFVEGSQECEVLQINDRVAINLGPGERVVGIEVLDASQVLDLAGRTVVLENLTQASSFYRNAGITSWAKRYTA